MEGQINDAKTKIYKHEYIKGIEYEKTAKYAKHLTNKSTKALFTS